jgi:hypothetical protein
MLWQAHSDLRASERPSEDSGKGDKPNNHGIVHLGVPSADETGVGMTGRNFAKGRRNGIVERFNRAKFGFGVAIFICRPRGSSLNQRRCPGNAFAAQGDRVRRRGASPRKMVHG